MGRDNERYPGLPRRLKSLRNAAGLSRQELAERAGVTFNTINDIERGRRPNPMEKTVQSLAQVLSVSYEYLARGESGLAGSLRAPDRWHRIARAPLSAAGLAALALLLIAAVHTRWEFSRDTAGLECVVRDPGGAFGSPRFEDVDADGMVELIRSSNVGKPWSIVNIDDSARDAWKLEPALALGCEDARHSGSFAYDVQGDGRLELLNLCRADGYTRIEVRDSENGDVTVAAVLPPPPLPGSREEIVAVLRDASRGGDVAFLTSASEVPPHGNIRCVDIHTGHELWSYASDQEITAVEVSPTSPDAGLQAFLWSQCDANPDDHAAPSAGVTAIDSNGAVQWHRHAGHHGATLSGCLLKDEVGAAPLVLVAANNQQALPSRPSHMLILDANTGARVDSIPYTDLVVNKPMSRLHDDGPGWDVYCGTEHGFIRRYHVVDGHIREEASRRIALHWVWTQEFLEGQQADGAIVVATADNVCYVVDRDLDVLFRREGADGAPISPVTTFVDPAGEAYVAFVCHGDDLCIDRFVALSGWGTRRWYVAAYAFTLGMLLVTRVPVRERLRTAAGSLPARHVV